MQKVALVTGSASGIGAATARRLAKDGMVVAIHSRSSREAGVALAAELGGSYHQADLEDDAAASGLVPSVMAEHGRLDVLVNNAGISWPVPHAELDGLSAAAWRRLLDVNLIAPWLLCTAALPALRESGGCVVNVTSHAGVRPKGSSIAYAASKAALNHVTKLLAAALGPDVRVNAVAPGLVDTPLTASWTEAQELWKTSSPMRRAAEPSDVADLISSLVHNTYITGEVVLLDGGLNLR
ncbi:SDR family oxidoreductase [Kribbella capetownensis]|uniref:SDR family oxidoreductase n=1 Tax=Kribbella capetownensis TaxID=1572659 RepID=A0A4R0JZM2_9ACTN|nr:SDR family oxidoreductase [Kribbella capetownensis]TCC53053.1 SDR family oxidoreductase [Kribbella capetownensis]